MPDYRQRSIASRRISVAFAAALITVLIACGGSSSPTSLSLQSSSTPPPPSPGVLAQALPITQDSTNFTFHYLSGDSVDPPHEEAWYAWAIAHLGVLSPQKIQYYKYISLGQMEQITGQAGGGWADPPDFSVHTIYPWMGHEVVHVLTALVGRPTDFFNEGIAVSMQVDPYAPNPTLALWNGVPLDVITRAALAAGQLPQVQNMADTASFRVIPDTSGYPWAGSFLQFVVTNYGMSRTLDFFRGGRGREEPLGMITSRFEQVYGVSLTDADLAWRAYLTNLQN